MGRIVDARLFPWIVRQMADAPHIAAGVTRCHDLGVGAFGDDRTAIVVEFVNLAIDPASAKAWGFSKW